MITKRAVAPAVLFLSLATLAFAIGDEGGWIAHVPEKEHSRANPFELDNNAPLSGAKLFEQHCSACHGMEAQGKGKRPNLHSPRIQAATPGDLQWLLFNGNLKKGMPSWSRLPEQQRWQLVSYLKTLR